MNSYHVTHLHYVGREGRHGNTRSHFLRPDLCPFTGVGLGSGGGTGGVARTEDLEGEDLHLGKILCRLCYLDKTLACVRLQRDSDRQPFVVVQLLTFSRVMPLG